MAAFDDVSGLPAAAAVSAAAVSAVPVSHDELIGVARTVASCGRRPAYAELEAELARALEAMGGPSALDEPDAAGGVFNIGSDQPVAVRQLAERVVEKVGGEIPIEHIAYSEAYRQDFEDIQRRVPEVDKLEQAIGSKPSMTLDEILDDIIAWRRVGRSDGDAESGERV